MIFQWGAGCEKKNESSENLIPNVSERVYLEQQSSFRTTS